MSHRIVSIVAIVAACAAPAPATAAPSWVLGLRGGVNLADLSGDGAGGAEIRTAFEGGGFLGADFSPCFGVRLEALFVSKGAEGTLTTPGDDHAHEATWVLNDLELPLVAVGRIPVRETLSLGAFAGPTFAFNLKSEIESSHGTEDLGGITEDFELGGTAGAEVAWAVSRIELVGDVRYTAGFTNRAGDVPGAPVDVKTRGLGIRLGLQVSLSGR